LKSRRKNLAKPESERAKIPGGDDTQTPFPFARLLDGRTFL